MTPFEEARQLIGELKQLKGQYIKLATDNTVIDRILLRAGKRYEGPRDNPDWQAFNRWVDAGMPDTQDADFQAYKVRHQRLEEMRGRYRDLVYQMLNAAANITSPVESYQIDQLLRGVSGYLSL